MSVQIEDDDARLALTALAEARQHISETILEARQEGKQIQASWLALRDSYMAVESRIRSQLSDRKNDRRA